jgi:hypothetical protein
MTWCCIRKLCNTILRLSDIPSARQVIASDKNLLLRLRQEICDHLHMPNDRAEEIFSRFCDNCFAFPKNLARRADSDASPFSCSVAGSAHTRGVVLRRWW